MTIFFSRALRALRISPLILTLGLPTICIANSSRLNSELYSQTISRPEKSTDRAHGLFHETRARVSMSFLDASQVPFELLGDLGVYLLAEWPEAGVSQKVASPYLGLRLRSEFRGTQSVASITLLAEGRQRERLEPRESGDWDPRTGAVVGLWSDLGDLGPVPRLFVDVYADLISAPRYSSVPVSTASARFGTRLHVREESSWSALQDLSVDLFHQDAASVDLGTRRGELRAGWTGTLVGRGDSANGQVQLRLFEAWSFLKDGETRPRFEGLLVLGVAW